MLEPELPRDSVRAVRQMAPKHDIDRTRLTVRSCLASASSAPFMPDVRGPEKEVTPPQKDTLDNAREAFRSGRYAEAPESYEYLFDHALDDDPHSLYGARIS